MLQHQPENCLSDEGRRLKEARESQKRARTWANERAEFTRMCGGSLEEQRAECAKWL